MFENPAKAVRIVAFFVAGVVLSVGGALIYATVEQLHHPVQVAQEKPVAQEPLPSAPVSVPAPLPGNQSTSQGDVSYATVPTPAAKPREYASLPERQTSPAPTTPAVTVNIPPPPAVIQSQPSGAEVTAAPVPSPSAETFKTTPAAPQPHVVTLPVSTALTVKLLDSVSTDFDRAGDVFRGTLESPIIRDGFVIADRGSLVYGRIAESDRAHLLHGKPDLALTLTEINTTDGQSVRIVTSPWEERGQKENIEARAKRATSFAFGALKDVVTLDKSASSSAVSSNRQEVHHSISVNRGAQLTFLLAAPLTLTEHLASR